MRTVRRGGLSQEGVNISHRNRVYVTVNSFWRLLRKPARSAACKRLSTFVGANHIVKQSLLESQIAYLYQS